MGNWNTNLDIAEADLLGELEENSLLWVMVKRECWGDNISSKIHVEKGSLMWNSNNNHKKKNRNGFSWVTTAGGEEIKKFAYLMVGSTSSLLFRAHLGK